LRNHAATEPPQMLNEADTHGHRLGQGLGNAIATNRTPTIELKGILTCFTSVNAFFASMTDSWAKTVCLIPRSRSAALIVR
jgi:hypothetical protein